MKLTGSRRIATSPPPDPRLPQLATTRAVRPVVSPTVSTTNTISVQTVDLTDLIFVHSASSSPPKAPLRRCGSGAASVTGAADAVVMACSPAARSADLGVLLLAEPGRAGQRPLRPAGRTPGCRRSAP